MTFLRRNVKRIAVVAVIAVTYSMSQSPALAQAERSQLVHRFHFTRLALPRLPGPQRSVRPVNPSLARISAWISSVGAAVALADIDGDGLPNDVCYVDTQTNEVVVAPVPGTGNRYKPFALDPGPLLFDQRTMAPMGCLPGDLNEDGLTDLLIYYWGRTPIAFLQRKESGTTKPVRLAPDRFEAVEVVPGGQRWYSNTATLADLDGDGHLDLVVGNYFPDGAAILDPESPQPQAMQDSMARAENGGGPHFLRWARASSGNHPRVQFDLVQDAIPPVARHGWTLALAAGDLTGDLLPEVYVANDFGPDRLLLNVSRPGRIRFMLVQGVKGFGTPSSKVLGKDSFKGMGVDLGDLGNGLTDIVVSNITSPYALEESNFVFMNTGDPSAMARGMAPFVDRSEELGLSRSGWSWDVKLGDFDNSGGSQVVQAVGFIRGTLNRWPELHELAMTNPELLSNPATWPNFQSGTDLSGHECDRFWVRAANGRFYDIGADLGLCEPGPSRSIALADVDGSGRLDFAVANQWATSFFFRNDSPNMGNFLGLHLLLPLDGAHAGLVVMPGHQGSKVWARPAIGAEVTVRLANGRRFLSSVDGGNGHGGKRSPDVMFGLGRDTASATVQVRWRDSDGQLRATTLSLSPGWYTIVLGQQDLEGT